MLVRVRLYLDRVYWHEGGAYSVYIDASDVLLFALLLLALMTAIYRRRLPFRLCTGDVLYLALMGWSALTIRWDGPTALWHLGLWELIRMGRAWMVFLLIRLTAKSDQDLSALGCVVSLSVLMEGLLALGQYVTGNTFVPIGPISFTVLAVGDYRYRVPGTFDHSNGIGAFHDKDSSAFLSQSGIVKNVTQKY